MNSISSTTHEETFLSPHDGSRQTFLLADFQNSSPSASPLLVVYLHGACSHQDQGMTPGIYGNAFGRLAQWMSERNAVYLCPEYRGNSWMSPAAEEDVREIFRIAIDRFRPSRTLLVGGSMGGTSALIFTARNPGIVDGILAFCPATDMVTMYSKFPAHFVESYGGTPDEIPAVYHERSVRFHATNLALQRLAILHGTADATMPVQNVRDLVADLHASHAPVRYSEIKGGNHDAPLFVDFIPHLDWLVPDEATVSLLEFSHKNL